MTKNDTVVRLWPWSKNIGYYNNFMEYDSSLWHGGNVDATHKMHKLILVKQDNFGTVMQLIYTFYVVYE